MFRHLFYLAVFLVGLAAVCWIGAGYIGSNPLGAGVAALIGACYLAGALELQRYRQASVSLQSAVTALSAPPASLGEWLDRLHPGLRNAVRLRVEGERAALPAPSLTPYLVGLLVLLGMLGTLLGMMATLRGTGLALESATDLQAMRGSLAAPVKGLGFAFGTSIAGVAASAMLGLLSALCRRERLQATQLLDLKIATSLRIYSQAHQREEAFRLLQRQTEQMPALVDRLQAMIAAIERQNLAAGEQQLAGQEAFHARTEAAYVRLAGSVEQSLKDSVAASSRAVGTALQPVMETTMAGLARETATLHDHIAQAVQRQLDGLSSGFETAASNVAQIWQAALAEQRRANETLVQGQQLALERYADHFEQRSAGLLEQVSSRLDGAASHAAEAWHHALSRQQDANAQLTDRTQHALAATAATFEQHAGSLVDAARQSQLDAQAALEARDRERLAAWTGTLEAMTAELGRHWAQAGDHAAGRQQAICDTLAETARDISAQTQAHASETIAEISRLVLAASKAPKAAAEVIAELRQSQLDAQATLETRDRERLAAWTGTLETMTAELGRQWAQAGDHAAGRQQAICDTLAETARDISAQTQAHASETIAEISRLVQAASEAPKAAAEVIAELRQQLSDSMVRDTATLEERSRLLATVETLLDAVNHASTEQRAAVDALVGTSAELLDRVGTRFTDHIEAETGKLGTVAAQITGSAAEVASLGEALGVAVQLFGQSNEALTERLQLIAEALDKSSARSDEQLAYYVAQAREVIDLSMLSQRQIIEDLQQIAAQRAAGTETA
jgi:hypothetical protein